MSEANQTELLAAARAALDDSQVGRAAAAIRGNPSLSLGQLLELARALAAAAGADADAAALEAELRGYQGREEQVPPERRATGFASSFPVRALDMGLLDPEEIFLANREKFSQVTLTIVQPLTELQQALAQLEAGGVLALRVPASEVTGHSAGTDDDTEVYIYILPREIQRIVERARAQTLETIARWVARAVPVPAE